MGTTKESEMTVTKDQLREQRRGKGGTLVRIPRDLVRVSEMTGDKFVYPAGIYVVKDLMQRKNYNKPDRIGIGPLDRGIAFGVTLEEIEPLTTAPMLHRNMLAALRQLRSEKDTAARRRRWAEVVAVGVARGWNDADGNLLIATA